MKNRFCIIIPVYNHGKTLTGVLKRATALGLPVIVVDDGSQEPVHTTIIRQVGMKAGITCETGRLKTKDQPVEIYLVNGMGKVTVLRHKTNMGKGAALVTGMKEAAKEYNWAITMDADGQHSPEDAIGLMETALKTYPRPIVVGRREGMWNQTCQDNNRIPWTSKFGRNFSNFWVWVSGGPKLSDSQSGFRVYPLPETLLLNVRGKRYQYEVEVLVRAWRKKIPVVEHPVSVKYENKEDRISHFRPFMDFMRNSATFSRLIAERILWIRNP